MAHERLLEFADVRADERFADNPVLAASNTVRFYAGVPISLDGLALGTLCVADGTPRELSAAQRSVRCWPIWRWWQSISCRRLAFLASFAARCCHAGGQPHHAL